MLKTRRQSQPKPELGQERVSIRAIGDILPAPENDTLYKPVDTSDPALISLADDIIRNGILDPLVVTKDGFLISGHRRLAAARLAGLVTVPILDQIQTLFLCWPRSTNSERKRWMKNCVNLSWSQPERKPTNGSSRIASSGAEMPLAIPKQWQWATVESGAVSHLRSIDS